tara:strand:+ start:76 stop:252 length:177 start_codon:yes stop_codon:yes gene_type:complete
VTHCLKNRIGHSAEIGRKIMNYILAYMMILLGAAMKFAINNSTGILKAAKSSIKKVLS